MRLDQVTVAELRAALDAGTITSRALVEAHLARIAELDPSFGAIRCLSPTALDEADASDRQPAPRSPLDGIPLLVKDNIDVAGLPTTGGALALEHARPARDAPIIARLRAAGVIILGKTNLTELANFLTEGMPSGYSSLGGQVLNPYDTSITPSGSSSGSAAAAALGLAPLTLGTETDGSIVSPASQQSLVGVKPTLGLVSRTGVLPIAPSQDTPGPMTRTVADAAALLALIAGVDPADPATAGAAEAAAALRRLVLTPDALAGVRLGVVRGTFDPSDTPDEFQAACHEQALAALRNAGAHLVDVTLPALGHEDELTVLHHEFAPAVDRYLADLGPGAPLRSLADLRAWNLAHAPAALKFGQTHVDAAVAIDHRHDPALGPSPDEHAYRVARARDLAATTGPMSAALRASPQPVDAPDAPAASVALGALDASAALRAVDAPEASVALGALDAPHASVALGAPDGLEALIFPGVLGCTWAARAGWPSIVVPAGYTANNRRPVGIMLVSRPWTDARLLALAHAFEQAHPVRRPPAEINPAAFRQSPRS